MDLHRTTLALILTATFGAVAAADDWPQFRGPGGRCVADGVSLPVEWSVETGAGVAWEADLPGNGVSCPIVVGGRVIVTAADGADNEKLIVLAFDSATGRQLWRRQFWATGRTLCYHTSSVAAPTPASDGQHVFALFSSNDLVCLDLDGNLKWTRGLTMDHLGLGNDIGMASSPVVVDGAVVVQCESQAVAFAGAYRKSDGGTLWEKPRKKTSNWASPVALAATGDSPAAVVLGGGLAMLNAATGEELWQTELGGAGIPSPAAYDDLVLAPIDRLSLLRRAGNEFEVVWRGAPAEPGNASAILYNGRAYALGRGGILAAVDAEDKSRAFQKRLGGSFWATPLAVDGKIYCMNEAGKAFTVDAADGNVLGESDFGEAIYATPAAADGGMFVRSHAKLWKIANIGQAQRQNLERR